MCVRNDRSGKTDRVAKSRLGMCSNVFNPLSISPSLGGEGECSHDHLRVQSNMWSMRRHLIGPSLPPQDWGEFR